MRAVCTAAAVQPSIVFNRLWYSRSSTVEVPQKSENKIPCSLLGLYGNWLELAEKP